MIKKAISFGIVGLLVIGGFLGILVVVPDEVEGPGPTFVSGIISTDTTWTLSNSPYIVIGNVLLNNGVNLTIEPGVEVKFDDLFYIQIDGRLLAIGNENDQITFTSNKITQVPGDWLGIKISTTGINSIIKYCTIEYGGPGIENSANNLEVSYCVILNNSADWGGIFNSGSVNIFNNTILKNYADLRGGGIWNEGTATIRNNTIFENKGRDGGGGIYNTDSVVIEFNEIYENTANSDWGGGVYNFASGNALLDKNIITENRANDGNGGGVGNLGTMILTNSIIKNNFASGYGGGIMGGSGGSTSISDCVISNNSAAFDNSGGIHGPVIISNSLITKNIGWGITGDGSISNNTLICNTIGGIRGNPTKLEYNNIIHSNLNIYLTASSDVYAYYNWWGTTNTTIIEEKIYDYYDEFSLGKVYYLPFLADQNPNAPNIPPDCESGLQQGAPWPMFRGNVRHTGLSPYDTSGNTGQLKWSFLTGADVVSSPAIDSDGTIYVGSLDGKLYAIYPNGIMKWSYNTFEQLESSPAIGVDGTIYIGSVPSPQGKLFAIYPNGTEKWNYNVGSCDYNSPAIAIDGTIYISSNNHYLYALNPNGTEKWVFLAGDSFMSSPSIGPDGTIYAGTGLADPKLLAINPNGTEKWNFTPTGMMDVSSPTIGQDGTIYIGSGEPKLYALNPNGTEKWNFTTGNVVFSSPAIGSDGTIYVGSHDHKLYAIYPNGTEKWSYTAGSVIYSSPSIGSDGSIYFGSWDDKIYAVNPDGSEKWNFTTGGSIYSSPAIGSDGTIYIGSYDDKLYAIGGTPSQPPLIPSTPSGPTSGETNNSNSFSTTTTDPDGDQIKYGWDWDGDGTVDEWSALMDSGTDDNRSHSWSSSGLYNIKVKAQDEFGEESGWSNVLAIDIVTPPVNQPPLNPQTPSGPSSGEINTSYSFSTTTTDPEGDQIKYGWDWDGDGMVDVWSPLVDSGTEDNRSHSWSSPGLYIIKVKAQDEFGEESGWSNVLSINIVVPPVNQPPLASSTPSGQISGKINTLYSFSTTTTDPEGDQIKYGWDWDGDGTVDEWSAFVDSGTEDTRTHIWLTPGVYNIKVKVQDENGDESGWSNAHSITIASPDPGPPLADSQWPKLRGNMKNTGLSPYDTSGNKGETKWKFETDFKIKGSPAIGPDGTIYVGSYDSKFYAINPDGSEKWHFTTGGGIRSTPAISSDGTIYFGSYDNKFYALNPDGSEKWNYPTGDKIYGSPAIGVDGTIYIGSSDSNLYAFYSDGTIKWIFTTPQGYVNSCPAFDSMGTIYIGSLDDYFYAINPDGTEKWNFTAGNQGIGNSAAIGSDGTLYFGTFDNKLVALNPNGTEKWIYTFATLVQSSAAIGPDGTIYVGCNDKKMYAINPDGTKKWSYLTSSYILESPAIGSEGTIYFASTNILYAANPDGTIKWTYGAMAPISSPAIDSNGTIYIGSEDTFLYAIGPSIPNDPPTKPLLNEISILDISLSTNNISHGDEISITVVIQNSDLDNNIIIKFYDGNPDSGGVQIGSDHQVTIMSDSPLSLTQNWVAIFGNHTLYVEISHNMTNDTISSSKTIVVEEDFIPELVLSVGDINMYRFEPGEERTIYVEVTCYNKALKNVHLVILDSQNLTIDSTITPPTSMKAGDTTKFYLRIKALKLPEGKEKFEWDIKIQAQGDGGIVSNAEELDIVVSQNAVSFFNPVMIAGAVATGSLATLGLAAAASRRNENWKYLLLLTFAVPLYTRIHGKKTLDNFVRGQVFGHIQSKPGTHFNEIKKTLKVGNGNLVYHLRKLEKEGFIKSKRDRRFRRFYPIGVEVPEENGIKLSKTQESILDYIEQHPKSDQKDISKNTKESQQTVSYNINVLVREGFLVEEKFKGTKRYQIIEDDT